MQTFLRTIYTATIEVGKAVIIVGGPKLVLLQYWTARDNDWFCQLITFMYWTILQSNCTLFTWSYCILGQRLCTYSCINMEVSCCCKYSAWSKAAYIYSDDFYITGRKTTFGEIVQSILYSFIYTYARSECTGHDRYMCKEHFVFCCQIWR